MRRHGTTSVSGDYMKFVAAVVEQLPRDLDPADCKRWTDGQGKLKWVLREALLPKNSLAVEPLDDAIGAKLDLWQKYYCDSHKLDLDLGGIRIPDKQDGFDRLVVVAQGLTANRVVEVGRKKYQMWLYRDDLDRAIVHNDREPKETYAIWVRDRQEADEEMANQSAEDIWFKKLTGVTLLERLVLGDEEFSHTGRHLDGDDVTFCSGSRLSDGSVPRVSWDRGDRRVCVDWYNPRCRGARLRCRVAVS